MRELAQRAFAGEFNDAGYTFRESDDDRAPVYALLPTGAKANRVFVVGTLTETDDVGSDDEYWQGRIVGPTGTFFTYAGQYQPEAAAMLREVDPPVFVALVGKPRTYETDDGDTNVSLRPEHLTVVDAHTRNRWVTETAKRTLERLKRFDDDSNEYAAMAREEYDADPDQYRQTVIQALEELTDDAETAPSSQDQTGDATPTTAEDASGSATEVSADEDSTSQSGGDIGDFDTTDLDS
ncbi:DNA-binding protein [Haloarcula sp. JP-Z28]|uniref:RPA family protein n=1 Tax=Haloarcula sp. JP-Z28 TaxID=2716715 RepID=UPI001404B429|nr:DNA-binding protein [Haloarcula sp. JP-Z28]